MSSALILKDLGAIQARLFDHRPVLQGEIRYFISEFETKRGYREALRLQTSLGYSLECSETLIPESVQHLEGNLPQLSANVSTAVEMCTMILERENDEERTRWLRERHQERLTQWSTFMDDMCQQSRTVDEQFKEDVGKVEEYYKDLEEKLSMAEKK